MAGIEEKIALEAVKPASGFIDAILGSKIENVKLWANEKALMDKLDPNKLSEIMRSYLTILAHRVSEITSISFPQLKLNIGKSYEPLELERRHRFMSKSESKLDIPDIFLNEKHAFVIIDNAGMGKSTFSKYLVTQLLMKSERIPILYELRKINSDFDLVDNLARELDCPGNIFSRDLFYKLLELGKFVVILDGFDEVAPDYQEALSNQIYELSNKCGNNKLILTSRPQDTLPDLVHGESLKFKAFTLQQAKSLLLKYDSVAQLDIGKRLINEIDTVPEKFIETPLLVTLLYRTFGVNNSIADRVSTFYDEIYQALYKGHDLINKSGYGRKKKSELDFEDFRKLLRALSYSMMVNRKTAFDGWSEAIQYIDKASAVSSISPSSSSNYLDDLLVAVPLMQRDGNEFKFLHKTILEYFTAEYIVYNKKSSVLLDKIFHSQLAKGFEKVFDFLFDINQSLFEEVITSHYAKLVNEIDLEKSIVSELLNTLPFICNSCIGLWSEKESESPMIFDKHEFVVGPHATVTESVKLKGEIYTLAIISSYLIDRIHDKAWLSISEVKKYDIDDEYENINCVDKLAKIIGLNQWFYLTTNTVDKIQDGTACINLAFKTLVMHGEQNFQCVRIISPQNAETILKRIRTEADLEQEMESLF